LCDFIEQLAVDQAGQCLRPRQARKILADNRFPAAAIGGAYLSFLEAWRSAGEPMGATTPGRLGASVVVPGDVAAHLAQFEQAVRRTSLRRHRDLRARASFLRRVVLRHGCGLIEVQAGFTSAAPRLSEVGVRAPGSRIWNLLRRRLSRCWARGALSGEDSQPPWLSYHDRADTRPEFIAERLRQQVVSALAGKDVFNADMQRHESLTQALQGFVLRRRGARPGQMRIVYSDGSEARPFPLRCVTAAHRDWRPDVEFHAALISMRHLQMDRIIDVNWFTNREVPAMSSMAESDEFCYARALDRFRELHDVFGGRRVLLHLYHTGYVPAIMGFYRALVTMLRDEASSWRRSRADWLRVLPKLAPKGTARSEFKCGARWPE
jgi:hypothetical protein